MQRWPLELETDRIVALASVAVARSFPASSPAALARSAAAFWDSRRLCEVAAAHKRPGGRWSRRLVALREQVEQAAETGIVYVDALRADPGDTAAAAGIVEMLAIIQFCLVSAGQGMAGGEL